MAELAQVFISYSRRDGNEIAGDLETALRDHGFGVWRDVRNIDPAQDFTADIERGIDSGTDDFLSKPVSQDKLREIIRTIS